MLPLQSKRGGSGSTISPEYNSGFPRVRSASTLAASSPRGPADSNGLLLEAGSNASTVYPLPPRACLLTLFDDNWFGGGARAQGVTADGLAKAWYANGAATGSNLSLYQDDMLLEAPPVSALALLAEPQQSGAAAAGAPPPAGPPRPPRGPGSPSRPVGRPAAAGGGGGPEYSLPGSSQIARPTAGLHWQEQPHHLSPHARRLEHQEQARAEQRWQEQQQQQQQQAAGEAEQQRGAAVAIHDGDGEQQEQQQQQQQQRQEAPLGTWAHRQFKLPVLFHGRQRGQQQQRAEQSEQQHSRQQQAQQQQPQPSTSYAQPIPGAARGAAPAAAAAAPAAAAEEEEEIYARAAWRWRFAKRWQAEQARQLDPAASAGDGDGTDEALAYLAACGAQWDMPRTLSHEGSAAGGLRAAAGTVGSVGLLGQEQMLVGGLSRNASLNSPSHRAGALSSTPSAGGGGGARTQRGSGGGADAGGNNGVATRELSAVQRRAAQLLQAQTDLGRQAEERWREAQAPAGGGLWVGALLEAVEVDDWGTFKFVLVRLRDRAGRQKLLVRGSNYASQGKLLEGLHRQLLAAAAAHGVPPEPLEPVGGGVMEWRRDRDRHLHLHSGFVAPHSSGPGGPMAAQEVLNLAGVLTKQSLPMHYKVTTESGKAL